MLIGGNIMCILALFAFIDGATGVGIMTLIVGGIFFLFSKGLKVPPPPVPIATLKEEAIKYIHAAKELGEFPMTGTTLMLPQGEKCYLRQLESLLSEPGKVTETKGKGRLKVGHGVYMGSSSSRSVSHLELMPVETGELVLTDKNLYFKGRLTVRTISLAKIISVDLVSMGHDTYAIELGEAQRQKKQTWQVENPFMWGSVIKILKAMEDNKIALQQMQFDI